MVRSVRKKLQELGGRLRHAGRRLAVSTMARDKRTEGNKSTESILIMSPSKFSGSLGDEAMLVGACEWLQGQGSRVGVLIDEDTDQPSYLKCFDDIVVLEGAYIASLSSSRSFLNVSREWDAFGVFGADVIDGTYSEQRALGMLSRIYEAQCAGMPAQLLGSSVKDRNIKPVIKDMARAIGEEGLTFRDKVSRDRFEDATGLDCEVVADAAFLLQARPCPSSESIVEDIKEKNQYNIVWGMNTNYRLFQQYVEKNEYVNNIVHTVKAVEKKFGPSCVVLLPHDTRGGKESDFSVAEELQSVLSHEEVDSMMVSRNVRSYGIKYLCKRLDFVLTMRMHVAVAAMGARCPVASVAYQGKFDGLYSHFDLESGVMGGELIEDKEALAEFCKVEIEKREKNKDKIGGELKKVEKKARKNFRFVTGVE